MLQAFKEGIAFIAQWPSIYGILLVLTLIQTGLALTQQEIINYFLITADVEAVLHAFDSVQLLAFGLTILIGFILSMAMTLFVALQAYHWKTKRQEKSSMGLMRASGAVVILLILAFGLVGLWAWLITQLVGWIGFWSFFIIGVSVLLVLYALLKFTFALPLIGFGMDIQEALAQSWKITQKHLLGTIGVIVGLFVVGILFEVIVEAIIEPLDSEIIANAISILISTLLVMYSSAVLALAIPLDELNESPSKRHMHGMGMKR